MRELAEVQWRARSTLIETRFTHGKGGHRFWLLIGNILTTMLLFCYFCMLMFGFVGLLAGLGLSAICLGFIDIEKVWKRLTLWR